jgi:ketosteroid isomerase-like protein
MTDTAPAEILELEERRCAAIVAKDTATLSELLADEMVYTHSSGTLDTKTSFLKALEARTLDYRGLERSDVEAVRLGDTALVTGRCEIHVVSGERELRLNVRFSAVWAHVEAGWRFLCWQSTSIRD